MPTRYGTELRNDLARVLKDLYGQPTVDVTDLLNMINDLATDHDYRQKFHDDETFQSSELTKRLGLNVKYPGGVPTQPQLAAVHAKGMQVIGGPAGGKVPAKAAATMMLGQT